MMIEGTKRDSLLNKDLNIGKIDDYTCQTQIG